MKSFYLIPVYILLIFSPVVSAETETVNSIIDDRRDILQYGIDDEVIELISKLKTEKENYLDDEILKIIENTINTDLKKAAFDLFLFTENYNAADAADLILRNYDEEAEGLVLICITYLQEIPEKMRVDTFFELIDVESDAISSAAIQAVGRSGYPEYIDILIEYFEDDNFEDFRKPAIITALGELKAKKAVSLLIEILEDTDSEKAWRWNACDALGKIGDPECLNALIDVLNSNDTILRSYAVNALKNFSNEQAVDILIESLRDSFWRVRVSAAKSLGELKIARAIPILIYKAKNDPEKNVKTQAIKALGEIGGNQAFSFLREYFVSEANASPLRLTAMEVLVSSDLKNSFEIINEVIVSEWEKEDSQILDYTCKTLSMTEEKGLNDLFMLFLSQPDSLNIKIYGIRGIRRNGLSLLKDEIEKLTDESVHRSIRREAVAALDEL